MYDESIPTPKLHSENTPDRLRRQLGSKLSSTAPSHFITSDTVSERHHCCQQPGEKYPGKFHYESVWLKQINPSSR